MRRHTVSAFVDLSKAFDCISHELLILKLYCYNISSDACRLISSYLLYRRQCVLYNGETLGSVMVRDGVPQGSVLGTQLSNLYINHLPALYNSKQILLANDAALFCIVDDSMLSRRNIETELLRLRH